MTPLVLAHRGACRAAPENTVEAFRRAGALGADGVELDVHRTADEGLVVHHDAMAPGFGVLADHPLDEVRRARPSIPTLAEALDACSGLLVNIEVKNLIGDADYDDEEKVAAGVVKLLRARGRKDDVLVSSFSLDAIDRVRTLDDTIPTAFLTLLGFDPLEGVTVAYGRDHGAVHPDVRSLPGPVAGAVTERAHDLGLAVNVWTVDEPDEMRRLAEAGVDGLITDVPDVARRVFGE